MYLQQVIAELRKPFAIADHQEQVGTDGKKHFAIPWQKIRDRLDQVYPDWQVSYSDPLLVCDRLTVKCRIIVAGIAREATGIGMNGLEPNPEAATIEAFVNAAAKFGIGDYLKDAEFVSQYVQKPPDLPNRLSQPSQKIAARSHHRQQPDVSDVSFTVAKRKVISAAQKAEMAEVANMLRGLTQTFAQKHPQVRQLHFKPIAGSSSPMRSLVLK